MIAQCMDVTPLLKGLHTGLQMEEFLIVLVGLPYVACWHKQRSSCAHGLPDVNIVDLCVF